MPDTAIEQTELQQIPNFVCNTMIRASGVPLIIPASLKVTNGRILSSGFFPYSICSIDAYLLVSDIQKHVYSLVQVTSMILFAILIVLILVFLKIIAVMFQMCWLGSAQSTTTNQMSRHLCWK